MKHLHFICLIAAFLCTAALLAQRTFTVMSYNVENVFDTIHDTGKNDYDFCPGGNYRWHKGRLFRKLKNIGKVIAAADETRPIDLVGLCEVENDTVMEYLTRRTPLSRMGYRYLLTHSDDPRGIDVALLYSPYTFHPVHTQYIHPNLPDNPTRDILHVAGTILGGDTLDVYVVHLPSKRGGRIAFDNGIHILQQLKANTDSIHALRHHPNIIIMGDFNADCHSPQLRQLTHQSYLTDQADTLKPGTYKYQGFWSTLDHIVTHTTTLSPVHSRILAFPFLVEPDKTYGGDKPYRTYVGPIYHGGISDHLPIVCTFRFQQQQ